MSNTGLPVQDIIEWDVPNWSCLIAYWTPILETLPRDAKVLTVGERNGGLTLWLALMGFHVVCTDRESPEPHASLLHKKYNVADKISYRALDIVHCDLPDNSFDIIMAKSVIGGLKADPKNRLTRSFAVQQQAVDNIYRVLKPGGYYFSAENLQGSSFLQAVRKMAGKNKGWRHFKWREVKELHNAFSAKEYHTFGFFPAMFSSAVLNNIVSFANRYLMNWLPANSKYIAFTAARK